MKKIAFIILYIFVISGCGSQDSDQVTITKDEYQKLKNIQPPEYPKPLSKPVMSDGLKNKIEDVEIVFMDSCEYIIGTDEGPYNGGIFLTHRARCKFCEQRKIHVYSKN